MIKRGYGPGFLIAEDDEDDYLLTLDAMKAAGVDCDVTWVRNGEELLEFLESQPQKSRASEIALILLDLNMPKMDGREALREIKGNVNFRKIPVIVMSTSNSEIDIRQSYDLGVNSFIKKPVRFDELVDVFKHLSDYWLKTVTLPH